MARFLAPNARAGDPEPDDEGRLSGRGYLNRPPRPLSAIPDRPETVARIAEATRMCDEPQTLDADEWKAHVDERHKTIDEQRRKFEAARIDQERRLLSFEQRIVTAHAEARRRCIDVSSELFVLRRMQSAGKHVRHLEQRLGTVERKVWRDLDEAA